MASVPTVAAALCAVEAAHRCRILCAADVGSRLWGYATAASDHDVHAIAVLAPAAYISIRPPVRSFKAAFVLETGVEVNITCYEVGHALSLLWATNVTVAEILASPLRWRQDPAWEALATDLARRTWVLDSVIFSLLNNFDRNLRSVLLSASPRCPSKKYLHGARMLLSVAHVLDAPIEGSLHPPVSLSGLLEPWLATSPPARTVHRALVRRRAGLCSEMDRDLAVEVWLLVLYRRHRRTMRGIKRGAQPLGDDDAAAIDAVYHAAARTAYPDLTQALDYS